MEEKEIKREEKKYDNYSKFAKILLIVVIIIALFSVSYAVFRAVAHGEQTNELTVGDVNLVITNESSNGVTLENSVPATEEEGKAGDPYTFDLSNTGDYKMNYKLGFELTTDTTMPASSIRYILTKNGVESTSEILGTIAPEVIDGKTIYFLEAGSLDPKTSSNYSLQIWIDYNASLEANGMKFSIRARADGEAVSATTSAWNLANKNALRTPIDDQISTLYNTNKTNFATADETYKIADGENKMVEYVIGETTGTFMTIKTDATSQYVYAFTKNSFGIEIGKWYQTTDMNVFSLYEGTSPISKSNFTNVYNETYLDQIIESFSY